ncbi:dihydrofolate reductase [Phocicoccus pinnipedialis]|uniref:Dihydrofolate reductase n=1 Tax=Phocicoccus pinnipedialis TaxID=110845 RepID=A0A6V7R5E0_9BACL|nr:dihydrofolate reductase [Jeotgalicoccus pinnipedialis]MBP1939642.1 dihydrofolate reductase [Jeotgalicoccus pinnipedialis]CAD2072264.1 Dihydrofolate reductase [Jeotgalicoccus pinnipedialis]
MLAYVWAEDENRLIGKDDELPWRLPGDVKFFKDVTMRGDIVMGRDTYETIPKRPLKGRRNIVLTHREDYDGNGAIIVHSKEEILRLHEHSGEDFYIIGGATLFEMFENEVDELYRTVIHESFNGDTYFPGDFDYSKFERVKYWDGVVDDKNIYPHTFEVWKRIRE